MSKEERPSRKDYAVHIDAQHYDIIDLIKKQMGYEFDYEAVHHALESQPLLPPELMKKLGNVFIEGTIPEKMSFVVDRYLEINEKFPYLTTQGKEITPEDADFPPCPYQKAVVWEGKFLGFQCRSIKPLAFKLNTLRFPMKIGSLSVQVTTPEDCLDCMTIRKEVGIGVGLKGVLTIDQLQDFKKRRMTRKEREKPQAEKEIGYKLEQAGLREMKPQEIKGLFKLLRHNSVTQTWKGKANASKLTGISRPTIDKILKALPNGID